jgi:hypothetical protein
MTEWEITANAERFWRDAGEVEAFPRSLERAVSWALPLTIIKLARLGLDDLRRWLTQRRVPCSIAFAERPLRGALLARAGHGLVFLDGSDPDEERRFSLAHEVAHFICDYLEPRERALQVLGDAGCDLFDGRRHPAPEERLTAALCEVDLGFYTHWMDRRPDGTVAQAAVLAAEDRADRLALELLAPRLAVVAQLDQLDQERSVETAAGVLRGYFGLPPGPASRYAAMVLAHCRADRSFRSWLGLESCRAPRA